MKRQRLTKPTQQEAARRSAEVWQHIALLLCRQLGGDIKLTHKELLSHQGTLIAQPHGEDLHLTVSGAPVKA